MKTKKETLCKEGFLGRSSCEIVHVEYTVE
jgi:hypothetical protein